jgi:hypothetical protein
VPNNVKMFIWRVCHNLLPTKLNLFKKRVIDSPLCPICNQVKESVEHIVWLCPSAVDVWSCGSRKIQKSTCSNMSFANLFEELVERFDQQQLEVFAVVARCIWLRRNEIVHGKIFTDPIQLYAKAVMGLEEFHKLNTHLEARREVEQLRPVVSWIPPPRNMVKINFDAALDSKNNWVGLGLLARDEQGHFLVACGLHQTIAVDPTMAEARDGTRVKYGGGTKAKKKKMGGGGP